MLLMEVIGISYYETGTKHTVALCGKMQSSLNICNRWHTSLLLHSELLNLRGLPAGTYANERWPHKCQGACTQTHNGFLPDSDPAPVVEFFTRTGIAAVGGQFYCERCPRKMFVHRYRNCNLLVLLYLRRKKKSERQYWIYPILTVRYLEGSFYTLFEKLKSHDYEFFNYFRMSVSMFEFLLMRLSDGIKGKDTAMRACVPPKECQQ